MPAQTIGQRPPVNRSTPNRVPRQTRSAAPQRARQDAFEMVPHARNDNDAERGQSVQTPVSSSRATAMSWSGCGGALVGMAVPLIVDKATGGLFVKYDPGLMAGADVVSAAGCAALGVVLASKAPTKYKVMGAVGALGGFLGGALGPGAFQDAPVLGFSTGGAIVGAMALTWLAVQLSCDGSSSGSGHVPSSTHERLAANAIRSELSHELAAGQGIFAPPPPPPPVWVSP